MAGEVQGSNHPFPFDGPQRPFSSDGPQRPFSSDGPNHPFPFDGPQRPLPFLDLIAPLPPLPSPRRRRRPVVRLVVMVVVLAVVAVSAWSAFGGGQHAPGGSPDSYAFMKLQDDGVTPAAFDPCRPIHYVVHPDGAPRNGQQLLAEAVDRISAATGLTFVYDGETDRSTASDAPNPDANGVTQPVLVAWTTPQADPELAGSVLGVGGPAAIRTAEGTYVLVSGQVSLDAPALTAMERIWGGSAAVRAVLMHELGHVVGLDHVDDTSQVMAPDTHWGVTQLGAGDLAGLALLGTGVCVPDAEYTVVDPDHPPLDRSVGRPPG